MTEENLETKSSTRRKQAEAGKRLIRQSWALGKDSLAFGTNSLALGSASIAIGNHVVTRRSGSAAFGRYNIASKQHLLTIGNGCESNPYNVFSVDERGSTTMSQIKLPTVNLCDYFPCHDDTIEPGDVVVINQRTGVVSRKNYSNRCKPVFGVVVKHGTICTEQATDQYEHDAWGSYRYQNVSHERWCPKMEQISVPVCSPRMRYDGNHWIETSNNFKKILRPLTKKQPVYGNDGRVIRYQRLRVMEKKIESTVKRIPCSSADSKQVLVCFLGTTTVKVDQTIPQHWIFRGKTNNEKLQRWFVHT